MRRAIWSVLLSVSSAATAAVPVLTAIRVGPAPVHPNLAPNPSFEEIGPGGVPSGWAWSQGRTDSVCRQDDTVFHSGKRSVHLTSTTPFGAEIYGTLWAAAAVPLTAGHPYVLSAYVRTQRAGVAWIGGGHDWQFRVSIPDTRGMWRRVTLPFTPQAADTAFVPRINIDSSGDFWVDDLKLEEGATPTPVIPAPGTIQAMIDLVTDSAPAPVGSPDLEIEGDGPFRIAFSLVMGSPLPGSEIEATMGKQTIRQAFDGQPGAWMITVSGDVQAASSDPQMARIRLLNGGAEAARLDAPVRFLSGSATTRRLAALRKQLPELSRLIERVKASGQDPSYPLVSYTVLKNFAGFVESDLTGDGGKARPQVRRAIEQMDQLEAMAARLRKDLTDHTAGGVRFPDVPRWTGEKRPRIEGGSFIGPTRVPGQNIIDRPIFFYGYGHFGQVIADIEKLPGYGANVIQFEIGPSAVFPSEDKVDLSGIQSVLHDLDRAAKAGVGVALLISPHYMPGWVLAKYPSLVRKRDGFLQYSLFAPEGQEILKRFIQTIIPPLKDLPALNSICLSNEPVNAEESGPDLLKSWHEWLEKKYGGISNLNAAWDSTYASIDVIPIPDPFRRMPASPLGEDYVRFNQEFFAGWHRMLADAIHAAAPDLPVHAKAMTWTFLSPPDVRFGVDAYLFGQFSQINGNDSADMTAYEPGDFADSWQQNAEGYDLQKSVKNAPVFNTENHVITDRDTRPVSPDHIRCALWQEAVHGQGGSAIWVWERTFDPKSDFAGSILHRPDCVEAAGRVNLDLNRAAIEVTALQSAPVDAAILQSTSAAVWDAGSYGDCLSKIYTALSFTGLTLGFVEERQLEDGQVPSCKILFVPNVLHLSDAALDTLKKYTGRLVYVGTSDLLSRTAYGRPRSDRLPADLIPFDYGKTTWQDLWKNLQPRLVGWNAGPAIALGGDDAQPVWGVEWRTARTPSGILLNLCSHRQINMKVRIVGSGPTRATDVLTGERVAWPLELRPMEVRLLKLQ